MVVESRTYKLNDYDILCAIAKESIKKEDVDLDRSPDYPENRGSATSSTISVVDLLKNVNILSK